LCGGLPGCELGVLVVGCLVLIVPLEVVTLTVSTADELLPPEIVNVHVAPAPTGVTVNVPEPDWGEIVATLAEQVIALTENEPEYPLCDAVVVWLYAVPAA
jgi:hypothetical protein